VRRYLSIPVISDGKAVAVLGLANKSSDYTNDDIIYLSLFIENMLTILQKKKAELSLLQMNKKLSNLVKKLEEKTQETQTLNDMASQLQSCQSTEEAFSLSAEYLQKLCPGSSGTFYLISQGKREAEAVKSWGESAPCANRLNPEDCRAIRDGRPFMSDGREPEKQCGINAGPRSGACLCLPIAARGETVGILSISRPSPEAAQNFNQKLPLCISAVEHISAMLINLRMMETLWQQAIRDNLTGLFNRRYLDESLPLILNQADRAGTSVGIIMFDIDHFKDFNDTCGHDSGDVLLRELGIFLSAHIRGGDVIVRYGGDEFLAVLPGATLEDSLLRADELRRKVKDIPTFDMGRLRCTLSFGVAAYPEHGRTAGALLKKADTALYRAKHDGRDRVAAASPED
jgi:diguanylate cyclase (GGDEF)-like protein